MLETGHCCLDCFNFLRTGTSVFEASVEYTKDAASLGVAILEWVNGTQRSCYLLAVNTCKNLAKGISLTWFVVLHHLSHVCLNTNMSYIERFAKTAVVNHKCLATSLKIALRTSELTLTLVRLTLWSSCALSPSFRCCRPAPCLLLLCWCLCVVSRSAPPLCCPFA